MCVNHNRFVGVGLRIGSKQLMNFKWNTGTLGQSNNVQGFQEAAHPFFYFIFLVHYVVMLCLTFYMVTFFFLRQNIRFQVYLRDFKKKINGSNVVMR